MPENQSKSSVLFMMEQFFPTTVSLTWIVWEMAVPTGAGLCDVSHHYSHAAIPTVQGTGFMIIRTLWIGLRIPHSCIRAGEMTRVSSSIEVLECLEMREDCIAVKSQMLTMLYGHSILDYIHQLIMTVVRGRLLCVCQQHIWLDLMHVGNVAISDVRYESSSQTLVCTSIGGPATSVTWSRDNILIILNETTYQQSQVITNTDTATYQNRLRIVTKLASLSGNYVCSVGNSKGETKATIEISGEP
jgi:hypothetical protein